MCRPESREVVDDAINYLLEIGACEQGPGNRESTTFQGPFLFASAKNEATDYGKRLAALLSNVSAEA
jgi:hypothetical protein